MTLEERIKEIEELKQELKEHNDLLPGVYLNGTFEELQKLESKISVLRCKLISRQGRLITQQTRLLAMQERWLQGAK
tara:strand:- start:84 stop:314 length:231 start_codon:yes stop_codon:yes gene_type:complete